jgi:hypothetical protein
MNGGQTSSALTDTGLIKVSLSASELVGNDWVGAEDLGLGGSWLREKRLWGGGVDAQVAAGHLVGLVDVEHA